MPLLYLEGKPAYDVKHKRLKQRDFPAETRSGYIKLAISIAAVINGTFDGPMR
jgi:hypothetical protein